MNQRPLKGLLTKESQAMSIKSKLAAAAMAACFLIPALAAAQVNPFGKSDFELAEGDTALIRGAVEDLQRENAAIGDSISWENLDSGNRGTVTYIGDSSYKEFACRRIQHDIMLKSTARDYRFIVDRCLMADGSWKGI